MAICAGLIQIPYVQTRIVGYVSNYFSEQTGFDFRLERINIDWFDQIVVKGLHVVDPEQNEMIYAGEVFIDFSVGSLIDKSNRNIDEVTVDSARIYLTKIAYDDSTQTLNINELARRIKAMIRRQSNTKKYLSVDKVAINNIRFLYNDPEKDSLNDRFDYNHFVIEGINGHFSDLQSVGDTLAMNILSMTGKEPASDLTIKKFESFFRVSQSSMDFFNMDLQVNNSSFGDSIRFLYNGTYELSEFNNKVGIEASLRNCTIYSHDLARFAPVFQSVEDNYEFSGDFQGKVNNFNFENFNLKLGSRSSVNGRVRMVGLPEISETFIDFDLDDSYIFTPDIHPYLKEATYARLKPFTDVHLSSQFLGYPSDFVANGDFDTNLGRIESDINLKLEGDINQSTYKGSLKVEDFDLGGYSQEPYFQKVTMSGQIEGKGFTLEEANFVLRGEIEKIGINQYDYRNITTDARFAKEFFEGFLKIEDPNLRLSTTGSIDLRKGINLFNVRANIDTVRLKPLNLSKEEFFIRTQLFVDAEGLELDNIQGKIRLKDSFVFYRNKSFSLDSLQLQAQKDETGYRTIHLFSNVVNADVEGNFDFSVLFKDLGDLYQEYKLNLSNNREDIGEYYAKKEMDLSDYSLNFTMVLEDTDPFLRVFLPDLTISKDTHVRGSYTGGYTSIASISAAPDTLHYGTNQFYDNNLELSISKIADSTDVLAMMYADSKYQSFDGLDSRNLFVEAIWNNSHIDFELDIDQAAYPNYARLFGSLDFLQNETLIEMDPSDLTILDKSWTFDPENKIRIKGKTISFEALNISNDDQRLSVDGVIGEDPTDSLIFGIKDLRLRNLNSLTKDDLYGTINGTAKLWDYYHNRRVESEVTVDDFTIEDFLVGDIFGKNTWNNEEEYFDTQLYILRNDTKFLDLYGTYSPGEKNEQLKMFADLKNTELKILEPFLNDYFTGISGTASGRITITGKLNEPFIRGEGEINEGNVHVNYLNTDYSLSGIFYLEPDRIGFPRLALRDDRGERAMLSGNIRHHNYRDFELNIDGIMSNFTVLDTKSTDNDLFYGTGIATGDISFYGPVRNLSITASAKTERGTRIFIPIGDTESIQQEDYIHFVDFNDTTAVKAIEKIKRIDLRGLNLDFDLDITPDAYCEIIFDIKTGDIIRGRGSGDLKLQIDTKGAFNMFGDFNIQEGAYNFTLYNIINKEFQILKGSRISWFGDPYQGVLDIKATYDQLASFLPLMVQSSGTDEAYTEAPELRRKYPVQVLLNIDGPLLTPNVDFDIVAENLPRNINVNGRGTVDLEFEFITFKNTMDEQELKRQVFSLIVLRRFLSPQSFNTGNTLTSSVSELLSNQLSYWITQVDENLEIDVDLGALDDEAFNTFQLRLSYTFLDGRLRVTRDGGFTNQNNSADISSVVGDWTVEYLLSRDGNLKVKMYNRANYNPINPNDANGNTITTGFSLIHTQNFDELKEIFKRVRKKKPNEPNRDRNEDEVPRNEDVITPGLPATNDEDETDG